MSSSSQTLNQSRLQVFGNKNGLSNNCVDIIGGLFSMFPEENLASAVVYPNIETMNPFQLPKGLGLKIHKKMPLNSTLLNKRSPSVCAFVKIKNSHTYTDQYFKDQLNKLNSNVPQYEGENTGGTGDTFHHSQHWDPELGKHGLIGVYKAAINQRGEFEYYIFTYCDAGESLSSSLYHKIKEMASDKKSDTIMGDLLNISDDNIMEIYKNQAIRNAKRLLYRCAESMEVTIPQELDGKGSEEFFAPTCAIPDFIQINNTIENCLDNPNYTVSYNMATSPFYNDYNMKSNKGNVLVLLTPEEGFIVAPIDREKMPKNLHGGIPFTLGKKTAYDISPVVSGGSGGDINDDKMTSKNQNDIISTSYVCESENNPRWDPSVYKTTRTNFLTQNLEELGWNKWNPVKEFIPVACKQSNINLSRNK